METHHVAVDAYAGYKGEETPRSFVLDGVRVLVAQIVDRWYTETHGCFRIRGSDGHQYVLRCDLNEGTWELVMRERVAER